MEKSEPTLVPEWLKNTGSHSSSSSSSSLSHLDGNSTPKLSRNKSFASNNGHDLGRSSVSDRTTSSYFRRSSSSNGSGNLRSYNSFGRNQRDRAWEKDIYDPRDKDYSVLGDRRHRGISDALRNSVSGKFDRDEIRRSQSATSGKHSDTWTKKVVTDTSSAVGNNNGVLLTRGIPGGTNKATFERNFPLLTVEEKASTPEIGRIPSPGLSSAIQSLPIGTSSSLGGEKWTSALAEVPVLVGSNGIGISSVQQTSSNQQASSSITCLNMAEAIAHSPNCPNTPQLPVGTQRLEELAIKQSRQLIPFTPSMPKNLVLNSSDKQKNKVSHQQSLSSLSFNNFSTGSGKSDMSKSSNVGKLHVLNPMREKNGAAPSVKDSLSSVTGSSVQCPALAAAPPVSGSTSAKGPPNSPAPDRKPASTVLEKRSTSQAQSRKEFFNLVRKKSMTNSSITDSLSENTLATPNMETAASQPLIDKSIEKEVVSTPVDTQLSESLSGDLLAEMKDDSTYLGDASDAQNYCSNGNQLASFDPQFSEEELALLRSMGWDENSVEDGLTEEEISTYFKKSVSISIQNQPPKHC